jgi:hypothetical protein
MTLPSRASEARPLAVRDQRHRDVLDRPAPRTATAQPPQPGIHWVDPDFARWPKILTENPLYT